MKAKGNTLSCMLVFCILAFQSLGQTTATPLTWNSYFDDEELRIELAEAQRADSTNGIYNNYLLIRVTNKTGAELEVSFQKNLSYNMKPSSADAIQPLRLQAHEIRTGSIDPATDKALRIFVNQYAGKNKKVLTDYSLTGISSTTVTH
ncbi:MAG: hypothetical protein A3D31_07490 [Candidatus Fluviicola riflensis]|nr:MAG: hypothetical protein CHH17_07520 [Candidatus Fluviicola riflensis]OGS79790.1 MAG: hypothetical protein A3D31_07490 [Candidatus Fluviicola riflensis]OGS87223.1 MAG: hypothetical protein A2724_06950 [Fluviicola sp. RIFCSPHIGHO2_01_FULL_43_53]OGS90011.1 MAG: hypothetical protein A3E30_03695 [Fluviicola sp. RIFCSPHIGHO2_12_FULL_43_24]